ncbi:MAG: cation transporter [Chlorobi bacterium]|nr:cation transporter [Chlorobiota bacterium]
MSEKVKTARLSIYSNTLLIILNLVVGLFSGSISIISEAIHTVIDLLASIMAYFSVKVSDKSADDIHQYGHGKFENISGVIEAILIFIASGWIIYHAVSRLLNPSEFVNHIGLGLGLAVMVISAVVNYFVSRRIFLIAKKTDSVALKADALHLSTHVYTSLGVGLSLLLIYFTGWHFLDPVAAIVVASYILREAYEILLEAFKPLTDNALPIEEQRIIKEIILRHTRTDDKFHMMRTRKAGANREVDFHLEVPGDMSVSKAHELCDLIEKEVKTALPNIQITIHVEPEGYHSGN